MDKLEDFKHYNALYDIYGKLLTSKQKEYFELYYGNDYSLGEIASSLEVSRNAIFDQVKKTCKILDHYEENLGILRNKEKRIEAIEKKESELKIDLTDLKNMD